MDGIMICPYCTFSNIEGADYCDRCGQGLSDLHLPSPLTKVERSLLKDRVEVLDPKKPITVPPDMPVSQVLQLLVENGIGCVIVTDAGRTVGIFSERDALIKLNTACGDLADQPVSQFMTANPQVLNSGAKIVFAVRAMSQGSYRHVPVVDETNQLTGIVSARDILRYLTARMQ